MLDEINLIVSDADLLYNEFEVKAALDNMASSIELLLGQRNPLLLCVMNGGMVVTTELMSRLHFPLTVDVINASRYQQDIRGGQIKWLYKPITPLFNRTVLVVDDILDEGITLQAVYDYCRQQGASSIYTAVLVNKNLPYSKPIYADFVGLEITDRYVFGYGMDYKGYCRNLNGIYALKEA